jgi:hypothetical protein
MTELLELAQLAKDHRVAQVDVRRGGIDAELDAQGPALAELALQGPLGKRLDGVAEQPPGRLGVALAHGGQC